MNSWEPRVLFSFHKQVRESEWLHLSSDLKQHFGHALSLEAFKRSLGWLRCGQPGSHYHRWNDEAFEETPETSCLQVPFCSFQTRVSLLKPLYHLNMWNYESNSAESTMPRKREYVLVSAAHFSLLAVLQRAASVDTLDCSIEGVTDLRRIYFEQILQLLFFSPKLLELRS